MSMVNEAALKCFSLFKYENTGLSAHLNPIDSFPWEDGFIEPLTEYPQN